MPDGTSPAVCGIGGRGSHPHTSYPATYRLSVGFAPVAKTHPCPALQGPLDKGQFIVLEETIVAEIKVQSEITGKVWAIEASVGDRLEEEDTIIVLESMKMEIPVVAPREGSLKEILVAEGDTITEGQDVAIMEG